MPLYQIQEASAKLLSSFFYHVFNKKPRSDREFRRANTALNVLVRGHLGHVRNEDGHLLIQQTFAEGPHSLLDTEGGIHVDLIRPCSSLTEYTAIEASIKM